jgi:hypothetical protein
MYALPNDWIVESVAASQYPKPSGADAMLVTQSPQVRGLLFA